LLTISVASAGGLGWSGNPPARNIPVGGCYGSNGR
jgi:hypothetical protein